MSLKTISVLLLSIFVSSELFAGTLRTYNYLVRIPKSNLSCQQEAQNLAQRFTAITKISTTEAQCRGEFTIPSDETNPAVYSILIVYKSETLLPFYQARFGETSDAEAFDLTGIYAHYADCLSDLTSQVALFEQKSGLKALAAYCDPGSYNRKTFLLKIDSFGVPNKRLYFAGYRFRNPASENINELFKNYLLSLKADIVKAYNDGFYYYAPQAIKFHSEFFAGYDDLNQCLAQKGEANKILSQLSTQAPIIACLTKDSYHTLEAIWDGYSLLLNNYGDNSPQYYTFEDCMSDRQRLIDLALQDGQHVLGAICTKDFNEDTYLVQIYRSL